MNSYLLHFHPLHTPHCAQAAPLLHFFPYFYMYLKTKPSRLLSLSHLHTQPSQGTTFPVLPWSPVHLLIVELTMTLCYSNNWSECRSLTCISMLPGPEWMLNKFCWMNEDREGIQITFTEDTRLDLRAVMLGDKNGFWKHIKPHLTGRNFIRENVKFCT